MAKPRVFLSSTYYDLRQHRRDIENFIKSIGYEPVLNERGNIPYGKDDRLEEYCYKEINGVDVLISVIGGRFGSDSFEKDHSISNMELKVARELNKHVFIFIDKSVDIEFQTFLNNKDNPKVNYRYVDDVRIYQFIEELKGLTTNNAIFQFETADDIITFLREQWAGLFQRLLSENSRNQEQHKVDALAKTTETLNSLVGVLVKMGENSKSEVNEILFKNHPAYLELKQLLDLDFPVVFNSFVDLKNLLRRLGFRNLLRRQVVNQPAVHTFRSQTDDGVIRRLHVSKEIFDKDEMLKLFTSSTWKKSFIALEILEAEPF